MPVSVAIPALKEKFQDYRDPILGDSYNWGPAINASNIDKFVFHHSVTSQTAKNNGNWKAECDIIAKSHVNGNGWGGVGYRFIICSDGTVAYVGDLSHGGSAVGNHNDHIFSACLVGDFTKELPTAAQIHSAHLLAKHFITAAPQYPKLNGWEDIGGHKEFNPTACPGTNWKVAGDSLYNRIVNDNWQGYPKPEPITTPPADPCAEIKKQLEAAKKQIEDLQSQLSKANERLAKISEWHKSIPQ